MNHRFCGPAVAFGVLLVGAAACAQWQDIATQPKQDVQALQPDSIVMTHHDGTTSEEHIVRFTPDGKAFLVSGTLGATVAANPYSEVRKSRRSGSVTGLAMRSTFEDIEDGSTDSPSSYDGTATRRSDVMRPVREESNLASFSCDTKYRNFRFVDSEDDYGRFVDVKFSPDGKTVAALEKDGTLRLWDWATGRLQSRIEPVRDGDFRSFAFSPDGKQLLLQDTDRTDGEKEYVVFLIDTAAGKPIAKVAYAKSGARGNYSRLRGVAFSPDGSRFAVGLSLWDANTGKLLSAGDPKHHSEGDGVLFSPDGKYVLAYGLSHRNSVVLWDLKANEVTLPFLVDDEYEEKRSRNYTHAVALSKDGSLMVSTLDSIVRLWDFGQRRLLANLVGGGEHVSSVAFSPDATTVAATFYDGATMFWDVSTIEAARAERPE